MLSFGTFVLALIKELNIKGVILSFWAFFCCFSSFGTTKNIDIDFFGDTLTVSLPDNVNIPYNEPLSEQSVHTFYNALSNSDYSGLVNTIKTYRQQHQLDDWFYYQLIRHTAQQISPKTENYARYTLYKWFLLTKSGYDARLVVGENEILFYVYSNDNIYDIPFYHKREKQYVCLNYHDYGKIDFERENVQEVALNVDGADQPFSYKIAQIPAFTANAYSEKDISFDYGARKHLFKVKLNPQVQAVFTNYPVVDFGSYFNIPMSKETYNSLIPVLKKDLAKMSQKKGVNYLMHFTRNAFSYEPDEESFGKEKRLSPEQTLFYKYSDCDDRAALFFYLVKEIYNLPMIALLYPSHITVAVQFDKPVGHVIEYNGRKYSVCEATPQMKDLKIGQLLPELRNIAYQVAYEYHP